MRVDLKVLYRFSHHKSISSSSGRKSVCAPSYFIWCIRSTALQCFTKTAHGSWRHQEIGRRDICSDVKARRWRYWQTAPSYWLRNRWWLSDTLVFQIFSEAYIFFRSCPESSEVFWRWRCRPWWNVPALYFLHHGTIDWIQGKSHKSDQSSPDPGNSYGLPRTRRPPLVGSDGLWDHLTSSHQ